MPSKPATKKVATKKPKAGVAQQAEQGSSTPKVAGSSPAPRSKPAPAKKRAGAPKGNRNAIGNKGGRPSKYDKRFAAIAKAMCELGATDLEIADALQIRSATFYLWKATHIEFSEAVSVGKKQADDRVERSLFARANGYEHDEVDIRVVAGRVVQTPIRKFYPPDTAAAIFWLKNRRKEEWRDKVDHEHGGPDGSPLTVVVKSYADTTGSV